MNCFCIKKPGLLILAAVILGSYMLETAKELSKKKVIIINVNGEANKTEEKDNKKENKE